MTTLDKMLDLSMKDKMIITTEKLDELLKCFREVMRDPERDKEVLTEVFYEMFDMSTKITQLLHEYAFSTGQDPYDYRVIYQHLTRVTEHFKRETEGN